MIHFIINILNKFYENTKLTDQVQHNFEHFMKEK